MPNFGLIESPRSVQYRQRAKRYLSLPDDNHEVISKNILEFTALKQVLKGKLKNLVNDPRPYETLKDEILTTEKELHTINYEILKVVIGNDVVEEIKRRFSYARDDNNKLIVSYRLEEGAINISNLVNSRAYDLNKNAEEIKLQIIIALFFNDKKISISKRLNQLHVQKDNENILKKEAELELAHRAISLNNTKIKYYISRIGKVIAANYAISQVLSLGFMCAVILIALYPLIIPVLLTAIWWIPVVYFGSGALLIAWFMKGTGRINWDGCRDNVPKILIDFWNKLVNESDVAYTWFQKIRLFATLLECIICGAVSGFFVHHIIITALILLGTPAVILAIAPYITIPLAIFAAANMFLFMYKFSYATVLGGLWQNIKTFCSAIFTTDENEINALINKLKSDYTQRYQHIYVGKNLEEKVKDKFDATILGIILNFNSKAIRENGIVSSICYRAFAMVVAAFVCAPLIIIGIIYGQLAAYQGLAVFLDGFMEWSKQVSRLLCFFSGTAYTSSFTYFTLKSVATKVYPKPPEAKKEDPGFVEDSLANSMDNGSQTAYGYVDSRRKEKENGEVEPLENAIVDVIQDPGLLAGFFTFTIAATLASYVFASAPEKSAAFDEKLTSASKKYKTATDAYNHAKNQKSQIFPTERATKIETNSSFSSTIDPLEYRYNLLGW
jgi:hypothetical protein